MSAPLSYRIREFFARLGDRVAGFGRALVSPFERFFAWIGDLLVRGGGGGGHIESGLARMLTWPFRALWGLLTGLGRLLFPQALRDGWSRLMAKIGHGTMRLVDALNLDRPIRGIVWLTQPVWRPIAAVLGFAYAWLATRPYRQMVWGLPALLLLMPVVATAGWRLVRGPGSVAKPYKLAVQEAREAGDYETMQLWERKLAQLGVDTQRSNYMAALKLLEDEDPDQQAAGRERMQQLAPLDSPGYPAAHFWLLQDALISADMPLEEKLQVVEAHLQQLTELGIKGPGVDLARARWLVLADRPEEAVDLLKPMADEEPAAAVQLMYLSVKLDRADDARRNATRVRDFLTAARERNGALTVGDLQTLAAAYEILGDADGFEATLRDWRQLEPDRDDLEPMLARIVVARLRAEVQSQHIDAGQLTELLTDVAGLGAAQQAVDAALGAVMSRRDGAAVLEEIGQQLLADADAPTRLLLNVGTTAAAVGDYETAAALLRRATEAAPENGAAWNNLAWVLSNSDDPAEWQEARAAADRAVGLAPDAPSFRETRGQVLVKLEQWDAAVDDLEYAINGLPDSKPTHAALAQAYEALGQSELAAAHQALAQ